MAEELAAKLITACASGSLLCLPDLLREAEQFPAIQLPTDQFLLQTSAHEGQTECLQFLLNQLPGCVNTQKKWDPPIPIEITFRDIPKKWRIYEDGVVHEAISGKDPVGIFQVLFDHGMSVDINLERAISPLAEAVARNQPELTKFLLSKGANPEQHYTFDKDTILGAAARLPKPEILTMLLDHGARIEGSQALRQASEYGRIRNAEILLQRGADVNERFTKSDYDASMRSVEVLWGYPLHFAVEGGALNYGVVDSQTDMVRYLLENGARVDLVDGLGETPPQKAQRLGKYDLVEVFKDYKIEE